MPRTVRLQSSQDLPLVCGLNYPCVLKPSEKNYEYGARFKKAYKVGSAHEVDALYRKIEPVLAEYRAAGHDVGVALPADTLFRPEVVAAADAVLAMYHDQGLPVLKSQGFGEAVNITLGLPFIRTSVDHGTALALAGTGQAKSDSLAVAIELALDMAARQSNSKPVTA